MNQRWLLLRQMKAKVQHWQEAKTYRRRSSRLPQEAGLPAVGAEEKLGQCNREMKKVEAGELGGDVAGDEEAGGDVAGVRQRPDRKQHRVDRRVPRWLATRTTIEPALQL